MSCQTQVTSPTAPSPVGSGSLPGTVECTIAANDTAQQLTTDITFFQKAELFAYKTWNVDGTITINANDLRIGWNATKQPKVIRRGESVVIEAPHGQKHDLSQLYVFGKAADKLYVEYS